MSDNLINKDTCKKYLREAWDHGCYVGISIGLPVGFFIGCAFAYLVVYGGG